MKLYLNCDKPTFKHFTPKLPLISLNYRSNRLSPRRLSANCQDRSQRRWVCGFFKNVAVSQPREKCRPTRGHIYVKCLTTATSFGCCKVLDALCECVCVVEGINGLMQRCSTQIQRFAVFFVQGGCR